MDIAKYILKKMTVGDITRYRDLKPHNAEGNLFVYHLKKLIEKGLIEKTAGGYKLTAAGLRYAGKISLTSLEYRNQPKIVNIIIAKNNLRQYLLYINKRQPFYNLTGFPYGKIHFGENLLTAASRELKEKTGLSAVLAHKGNVYLMINKDGELISHMLCHIFFADKVSGDLISASEKGICEWGDIKNFRNKFIPGFLEMMKLAENSKRNFFAELTFDI